MAGRCGRWGGIVGSSSRITRTGRLLAGALAFAAVLGAPAARAADTVQLALSWLVSGKNAGYFVALQKGYYAAEGLNVTISRGSGSGDTIKRIAAGESTFGLADSASVLQAQADEGTPVKMVAMMSDKSPVAVLYVAEAGNAKPQDLRGKTIARSAAGASVNMFPAFLKANGIERASLNEVVATPSSFVALMLSRKVEAVLDQSSYLQRYRKAGAAAGVRIDAFRYADYGLDIYGDVIFVKTDLATGNPDLVRRFVRASIKGSEYAFAHIPEAIEILRKTNPEIEPDIGQAELQDYTDLAWTAGARAHGLGTFDPERMRHVQGVLAEYLGLKTTLPLDQVYSAQFLPKKD
ncbi:ABC transporter substrate-binding protein [Xanthobacter sp. KR7-65]|uniref:ABC transporter substrate-binding protein n=1 Tax=Xanthobacter sp. KR7-65 TaxID=3156612 RepID=UPI0032B53D9E